MKEIKLFRFYLLNEEEVIYIVSTKDKHNLLKISLSCQDHGDMPWETWDKLIKNGNIERITSLDQVPIGEQDLMPYNAKDIDYEFQYDIYNFFKNLKIINDKLNYGLIEFYE